jgi:hypothetical protein
VCVCVCVCVCVSERERERVREGERESARARVFASLCLCLCVQCISIKIGAYQCVSVYVCFRVYAEKQINETGTALIGVPDMDCSLDQVFFFFGPFKGVIG